MRARRRRLRSRPRQRKLAVHRRGACLRWRTDAARARCRYPTSRRKLALPFHGPRRRPDA